ncbi:hypothetical protein D0T25_05005 [Duganella sp. BJB488]|nr:hypothetical protein D0T26_05045 [Duganella sp. BJB489]RFP26741.1 hypothetical protein D0T25_05005 [Duganella sp. BJB488]RFP34526.1 hypothetical protein D0T24_13025 [Duganella sp. BJB480]
MAGAPEIPRTWETLFSHALTLIGEIARHGRDDPFWTFGGGTVLMLRHGHRFSKGGRYRWLHPSMRSL